MDRSFLTGRDSLILAYAVGSFDAKSPLGRGLLKVSSGYYNHRTGKCLRIRISTRLSQLFLGIRILLRFILVSWAQFSQQAAIFAFKSVNTPFQLINSS